MIVNGGDGGVPTSHNSTSPSRSATNSASVGRLRRPVEGGGVSANLLREAALARAREGACLVPVWWTDGSGTCACPKGSDCSSPGKHPLTPNGLDDASNDPASITRWWTRWPCRLSPLTQDVARMRVLACEDGSGTCTSNIEGGLVFGGRPLLLE
jgi:hypothetical protein